MKRTILCLLLSAVLGPARSQFSTPVVDGSISPGEYGSQNTSNTVDGRTYYMTWNNDSLYVATDAYSNSDDAVQIYLDVNPLINVLGGTTTDGSTSGTNYDNITPTLPFRADAFLFVKAGYKDYVLANGAGGWGASNPQSPSINSYYSDPNDVLEFSIPWSALTGGSRPSKFNYFAFLSYNNTGGTGTFARIPSDNLGGASAVATFYYTISRTDSAMATAPFTQRSFAQSSGAINPMTGGDYFDVTLSGTQAFVSSPIRIMNVLTIANAGQLNTNDSVTLASTAERTARIAPLVGLISGRITMEKFIGDPAPHRAWRLMTAPLTNADTIYNAWQNRGVYTPGKGTFITGPVPTNGLDQSTGYSMKTWDPTTQTLVNVTNTMMSLSDSSGNADNRGYFLFIRGDRNPLNLTPPNTNATTLSASGTVQTGLQTFNVSNVANTYSLIGNPYPSPIDFDAVSRTNVVKRFYAWDPKLNQVGGYVLVDDINEDGSYDITPALTDQTNVIQSSQAFFVQTTTNSPATVSIDEISKSILSNGAGFKPKKDHSFRVDLYLKNGTATRIADGILAAFDNAYAATATIEDGPKMTNLNENLAFERDGQLLSIERMPLSKTTTSTLYLKLWNTTQRDYRFSFDPKNIPTGMTATLEDAFLNTSTPLSLASTTTVDFSITSNTFSQHPYRFKIVFRPSGTLPVAFTAIKGYTYREGIQVEWNVSRELDMNNYEIEKSIDGRGFEKVGQQAANANNGNAAMYTWFDANPVAGNNYYRVKAVEKSGRVNYSDVIDVNVGDHKSDILIYPNPVKGRQINLQFINEPEGRYTVQVVNSIGERLYNRVIQHSGGSAVQSIRLANNLPKGVYQLTLTTESGRKTIKFIAE